MPWRPGASGERRRGPPRRLRRRGDRGARCACQSCPRPAGRPSSGRRESSRPARGARTTDPPGRVAPPADPRAIDVLLEPVVLKRVRRFLQVVDADPRTGSSHILLNAVVDATFVDIPTARTRRQPGGPRSARGASNLPGRPILE